MSRPRGRPRKYQNAAAAASARKERFSLYLANNPDKDRKYKNTRNKKRRLNILHARFISDPQEFLEIVELMCLSNPYLMDQIALKIQNLSSEDMTND
jgi:hypothetical protein